MTPYRPAVLSLVLAAALLSLVAPAISAETVEKPQETRIMVFYDSTLEAHLLWPYRFRVVVIEDIAGTGWCWTTLANGTTILDPEKCRPLANTKVRVTYMELMEYREAVTDGEGIAEVGYRIFTFPRATFTVRIDQYEGYLLDYPVEHRFMVDTRPWALLSILSFSSMLSAMVYTLRRGWW